MDDRDWGHGNLDPHERQGADNWAHDDPPRERHRDEERFTYRPPTPAGWASSDSTGAWPQIKAPDWHPPPVGRQRSDDTGEWAYRTADFRGEAAGADGRDLMADTGQWDRFTDTGEWSRGDLAGPDQSDDDHAHRPRHGRSQTFWEGTRLSGDDPRWMATPASAPRSPAIAYSDPAGNLPAIPRPRHADGPPHHQTEVDALDADRGGPVAAMLYAAAWYLVPLLVLFVWMLTLDGNAPAGCLTDAAGRGCESERADAAASIVATAPMFGAALGASLVVAVVLRWISGVWRAASVGLAAAVIGGGLSTVVFQLITGRALG